jgi:hypothetical protein
MRGDTSGNLLGYFPRKQGKEQNADIALIGDQKGPSISNVLTEVKFR